MKGTHLGELEELILLAACVCYGNAYTVAIQEEIAQQTGRSASLSSVHAALTRLEKKGFVTSHLGGATTERGGRRKRLFTVTAAGKAAIQEARRVREVLWHRIPRIALDPGL